MINPIISIVVPVFKVEDTIHNCIKSILNQTFSDFEVILVDDGSPDRCGKICDEYALKDKRFKAIHKNNGGVSAARQTGLDNSSGEYIIHVDPDDWVEPTMLEELYTKAKESNADMLICDFFENIGSRQRYHKQSPSSLNHHVVLRELFQHLHGSCCNKLVRRECFNRYDIKFPIGMNFCEDKYVNTKLLLNDIKIAYLPKAFYHYVQYDDKSTMVKCYDERMLEKDKERLQCFSILLKDEREISNIMQKSIILEMIGRAFSYGNDVFDSRSFKEHFGEYKDIILKHGSLHDKMFIYPSFFGFYKVAYTITKAMQRIKRMFI